MKKTSRLIVMLCLCGINCSTQQREGWKKRFENLQAVEKQAIKQEELNSNRFSLTEDKQALIGLETTVVRRTTIDDVLELPAEIVPNPNNILSIYAPVSGKVMSLPVSLGGAVEKKALIAIIENPQNLGQRYEIHSPMNGTVTTRSSNTGEWIEAGKQILEITDYSELQGLIRLYPDEQNKVKVGQAVQFENNETRLKGRITFIASFIDPITRTIETRAEILNTNPKIKANAYAEALITIGRKEALVIPLSGVLREEEHFICFVAKENVFEKRVIETGIRQNENVEVVSGLSALDVVVSKGAYQLKNITFTSKIGEAEREERE